jgi:hypothetical protein
MCYGDPDHGTDGYYRQWIEDQQEQQAAEEAEARADVEASE